MIKIIQIIRNYNINNVRKTEPKTLPHFGFITDIKAKYGR